MYCPLGLCHRIDNEQRAVNRMTYKSAKAETQRGNIEGYRYYLYGIKINS